MRGLILVSLEVSGPTVEEAIRRALEQPGVSRAKVEIEEGKPGILGLGAEEVIV